MVNKKKFFQKKILDSIKQKGLDGYYSQYKDLFQKSRISMVAPMNNWTTAVERINYLSEEDGRHIEEHIREYELPCIIEYDYIGHAQPWVSIRLCSGIDTHQKLFVSVLWHVLENKPFHVWFDDFGATDGFFGTLSLMKDKLVANVINSGFSEGGG